MGHPLLREVWICDGIRFEVLLSQQKSRYSSRKFLIRSYWLIWTCHVKKFEWMICMCAVNMKIMCYFYVSVQWEQILPCFKQCFDCNLPICDLVCVAENLSLSLWLLGQPFGWYGRIETDLEFTPKLHWFISKLNGCWVFCDDIRSNIGGLGYGVLSSDFGSLPSVAELRGVQICGGSNGYTNRWSLLMEGSLKLNADVACHPRN